MLPHIHILGISVPMYSVMICVGAIAFVLYFKLLVEKREKIDRISSNRLLFCCILGFFALGGSAWVLNSFFHSIEEGKIVLGGITWLGGVIGLIPSMFLLIHYFVPKDKGNALDRFSTLLPGLVIAHAFGRIGCFCGGCCYGGPTNSFLGVSFPAGSSAGMLYPDVYAPATATKIIETADGVTKTLYPSVPVLPTQLIEAVFEILLFVAMVVLYKRCRKYNVEIYCFAYGAFRFTMEFFRGDDRGATGLFLTPSQFMCIILFVGAVGLILFRNKKLFKKLYAKCEVWRKEALLNPPTGKKAVPAGMAPSPMDMIRELYRLKEDGILTEEEFNRKKEELLKRI